MRKSLFNVLGATAVLGATLLTTTAASAAPHTRAATDPTCPSSGVVAGTCDTTVTFAVTTSTLDITAPAGPVVLGSGAPGTTIGPTALGAVTVSDNTASLNAAWTASAASTDFTGTSTGVNDTATPIPAGTYTPGAITTTSGTITATPQAAFQLSTGGAPTVLGTNGVGDNSATWNPTETVAVPPSAVGGPYTSTLTESVTAGGL